MRGAPGDDACSRVDQRIIPADAGSTQPEKTELGESKDHPRGCGEHLGAIEMGGAYKGSSPRMRGAHSPKLSLIQPLRIIPADAGSTCFCAGMDGFDWDHPRGCGEHDGSSRLIQFRMGSSPRMRGAQLA